MNAIRTPPKNLVQIEGEVVFDPKGTDKVTNFQLKVPTGFKDYSSRIRCVVWHADVESEIPEIAAGKYLRVEGRIAGRTYENKDQVKVEVTEVLCDSIVEVRHKSATPAQRPPAPTSRPPARQAQHEQPPPPEDDIPF